MPAPSLDHLLDFESRWDEALAAVLAQLGLAVHTPAAPAEKLEPPHLEGFFIYLGEAPLANATMPQVRGGAAPTTYDVVSHRGRFQIELHLHRGAQTAAQIAAWRGGIRRLLLPSQVLSAFNRVTLPYYDIASITLAEGERRTNEERDLDVTVLRYDFTWAILGDAWTQ